MADDTNFFNINKVGDSLFMLSGYQPTEELAPPRDTEGLSEAEIAALPPEPLTMSSAGAILIDGSDALANDGLRIEFTHVPSNTPVSFKAFINAFNETYNSDWTEESAFGRADPIRMFKQTNRTITLSFIVPAASQGEGFENLSRVQKLVQFLYPSYTDVDNALTISQSPLVRMKIMNLISNNKDTGPSAYTHHLTSHMVSQRKGLLGAITNVAINHNLDNPDYGVFVTAGGTIIPKAIEISMDFKVIHEQHLGWDTGPDMQPWGEANGEFSSPIFPYGADIEASTPATKGDLVHRMANEANAYTQAVLEERAAARREQGLQAAQDIARSHLLRPDGKLNMLGRHVQNRLGETAAHANGGNTNAFRFGYTDPNKAAYYAGALAAIEAGDDPNAGERVEEAQDTAREHAQQLDQQTWSWIK